jgi:hypothetical protein
MAQAASMTGRKRDSARSRQAGRDEQSSLRETFHGNRCPEPVAVRISEENFPAYLPHAPDRNPMFLEKRVYQGSSGKVYPLPFTDRISEKAVDRKWKAVWIENEFLRLMILPELGGRVHVAQDKTNGYDFIYRQSVIKPALVGRAGPWISGGIEFNWPQHHRPATFLPVDFEIEEHADGSKTVWCGDHDPMCRMKGMHGICLHPGKAVVELKVRAPERRPKTNRPSQPPNRSRPSRSQARTNFTSPAFISISTATRPVARPSIGAKHCGAIRSIPAATMPSASGICAAANSKRRKSISAPPSNAWPGAIRIRATVRRITIWGCV